VPDGADDACGTLRGHIDAATPDRVAGWAQEPASPEKRVELLVTLDGVPLARVRADRLRADLVSAGIGDGCFGFELKRHALLPLKGGLLAVCRESDGRHLHGSPILVPPSKPAGGSLPKPAEPAIALRGTIDRVTRDLVCGWAQDPASPDAPVTLLVTANDVLLARLLADRSRLDLRDAGVGSGRHAFAVKLNGLSPLERHVIAVRREEDGMHLEGSPAVLEPGISFDASYRAQLAALLADITDDSALDDSLAFLAEQAEHLLRRRAERRSRLPERVAQRQINWRWSKPTPFGAAATAKPLRHRALFIDDYVPAPCRDAGSNAALSHMRSLRRIGFEVTFVASDMGRDVSGWLETEDIACCHAPWHGSVEEVLRREADSFDLVYLHRGIVAEKYLSLARAYQPKARLVFGVADLRHLRLARQSEAEDRPELRALARRIQASELRSIAAADAVITHSTDEARIIHHHVPGARVRVVPWSVPVRPTAVPFADRHGVAFIGHYGHLPNLDAAQWLVDEIMPCVRKMRPGITCVVAGSNMPNMLRRALPGIEVVGHVAVLSELFDRVRLTVAPMTFGAGVKGKVLESLAAGVPCVCTPCGAEGIELPLQLQSLVAADVQGLAERIVRLHEEEQFNDECRAAGLTYAASALSEEQLDILMRDAAAGFIPAAPSSRSRGRV
jgi:glycosyltransferase involved in cell wall biosynthesis